MLVKFPGVAAVNDTGVALGITLEIISPTLPAAALLLVVVPIIPDVELNEMLVALAAPNIGVTNVGLVEPANVPVPVCPERVVFTALLVAISKSFYTIVNPADWGAPNANQEVLATVQIKTKESYRLVDATEPPTPTVDEEEPICIF